MKRVSCSSVTDTLVRAMEDADELESVIIVAEGKEGNQTIYSYENGDMTLAKALYLIRCYEEILMRMTFGDKSMPRDGEGAD
jgi:hypothetical protein